LPIIRRVITVGCDVRDALEWRLDVEKHWCVAKFQGDSGQ
jgi:hypothetical protein